MPDVGENPETRLKELFVNQQHSITGSLEKRLK